jgi:hypothetical protein
MWADHRAIRAHVLALVRKRQDPHRADLATALEAIPDEPVHPDIIEYVRAKYDKNTPRKAGRQRRLLRRGEVSRECLVFNADVIALAELEEQEDTRDAKGKALRHTAKECGISVRQAQRDLAKYQSGAGVNIPIPRG